jgi:hypothetical protein
LDALSSLFLQHLGLGTFFVPWFQGSDVEGTKVLTIFYLFFAGP